MIPYRADDVADPTDDLPVVTIGLIVVNFLVFFYELALGGQGSQLDSFINAYSLVPCEYTHQCSVYAGTPCPVLARAAPSPECWPRTCCCTRRAMCGR